jgi:hypothetical protein
MLFEISVTTRFNAIIYPTNMVKSKIPAYPMRNRGRIGISAIHPEGVSLSRDLPVPKGHVFGFIIYLMFCLPSRHLSNILIAGVQTDFTELGAVVLPFAYLFLYRRQVVPAFMSWFTRMWFLLFTASVALSGLIFYAVYSSSVMEPFLIRNLRDITPFLSVGLVAIQGVKIDRRVFMRWLFMALLTSYVLLVIIHVTGYQRITEYEGIVNESETMVKGRFVNQNWEFGVIGLCLWLDPLKRAFCPSRFDKGLVFIVSVMSFVQLIVSFNRTYYVMLVIELFMIQIYLAKARISTVIKTGMALIVLIIVIAVLYSSNEVIQRQIDNRILVFFQDPNQAVEDTMWNRSGNQDSRGALLEATISHIQKNGLIGIKPGEPIYMARTVYGYQEVYLVDNSIITIWLRFGLLSAICFLCFWISLLMGMLLEGADQRKNKYWRNYAKATFVVILTYFIADINTSSLTGHNAIYFTLLFPFLWRVNVGNHVKLKSKPV